MGRVTEYYDKRTGTVLALVGWPGAAFADVCKTDRCRAQALAGAQVNLTTGEIWNPSFQDNGQIVLNPSWLASRSPTGATPDPSAIAARNVAPGGSLDPGKLTPEKRAALEAEAARSISVYAGPMKPVIQGQGGPQIQPSQPGGTTMADPFIMGGGAIVDPTRDLLGAVLGGIGGFVTGGPAGAVTGAIAGLGHGGGKAKGKSLTSSCPSGYVYVNGQCTPEAVPQPGLSGAVARILPGGSSGYIAPSGVAVGSEPALVSRRFCGRGPMGEKMVLGRDGLCYPKSMLPASMKENPYHRPAVSWGDQKAIRQAASAKKRLVRLTNAAGAHASMKKPSRGRSSSRRGGTVTVVDTD